jgi:hypothetical protein
MIILIILGLLFFGIAYMLSSEDESKKSAKNGLNITAVVCMIMAIIIAIIKFMTRDKGTTNGNGNAGKKNGNGTPPSVEGLQKQVANLKEALVNEVTNKK